MYAVLCLQSSSLLFLLRNNTKRRFCALRCPVIVCVRPCLCMHACVSVGFMPLSHPAVIHLPPCHFPFRSCLAKRNVPPASLSWRLRALRMLLFELGQILLPDRHTHTHNHYLEMSWESYCGGMLSQNNCEPQDRRSSNQTLLKTHSKIPSLLNILMWSENGYSVGS